MSKPSIPQGTRDFSPAEVRKRQYIFDTLRVIFELYGFQPLETPSMENLTTLTGKYGEEGDRLIFKILNNGLHEKKDTDKDKLNAEWNNVLSRPYSSPVVTERALRYDLTIPFARYVVMHQNELAFPFRRYQMQPVWRADRPQKGRYREFWQCDADVVGSTSLINEAELLCIYQSAFKELKIPVTIKINSRKLLAALAELCGLPDKMMDITIALDKLDKIGWIGVANELKERGVSDDGIWQIEKVINVKGNNETKLAAFADIMQHSAIGMEGINELGKTLTYHRELGISNSELASEIEVDISLARGLNYYTGVIVEVVCNHPNVKMGSIGGGGRYDDLTGLFGLKGLSGVGVSFGIDRIYDVMDELNVWPNQLVAGAKAIIINFGGENEKYALHILQKLRIAGISVEIFPDFAKFEKQMKYANKRNINFVILPGDKEREEGLVSIKNFITGEQKLLSINEVISILSTSEGAMSSNIDIHLKKLLETYAGLKNNNILLDRKSLTNKIGKWLASALYDGYIAKSSDNGDWDVQVGNKFFQIKTYSKADSKTARWSQLSKTFNSNIDELIIIVFNHDYKLKKFYQIPWHEAFSRLTQQKNRRVLIWDNLTDYEIAINDLPKQKIIDFFR